MQQTKTATAPNKARRAEACPIDLKVLMNHIYEFRKGVRQMVLFIGVRHLRTVPAILQAER